MAPLPRAVPGLNIPEEAEIVTPEYGQVELNSEEQELYGSTLMNLCLAAIEIGQWAEPIKKDEIDLPMELKLLLSRVYQHGVQMQELIDVQLRKAGLKSVIT